MIFSPYRFVSFIAVLASASMLSPARAHSSGDWIDVHFHLIGAKDSVADFDEAARAARQIMDAEHIRAIVVMSPPHPRENFDFESFAEVLKKYGPRIAMLGGGGTLNPMLQEAGKSSEVSEEVRRRFGETAERIIASGAKGFGEIAAHHLSLMPSHAYEWVSPDHPLLLLLADIAARHGVLIDLHMDPVPADTPTPTSLSSPRNPPVLKANLEGFERLLAHNRKASIVWAHAGSGPLDYYTPKLVRQLLQRHSNLALSIRPTSPTSWGMVHPKGRVNGDWVSLLKDFPDRFVTGSDSFVVATNYSGPDAVRVLAERTGAHRYGINRLLSYLPAELARRIGYENAERMYGINR